MQQTQLLLSTYKPVLDANNQTREKVQTKLRLNRVLSAEDDEDGDDGSGCGEKSEADKYNHEQMDVEENEQTANFRFDQEMYDDSVDTVESENL